MSYPTTKEERLKLFKRLVIFGTLLNLAIAVVNIVIVGNFILAIANLFYVVQLPCLYYWVKKKWR